MKMIKTCSVLLVMIGLVAAAHAMPTMSLITDNRQPSVRLRLSTEAWVSTATARVRISAAATYNQGDLAQVRQQILTKLKRLAKVDWHVTNFYLSKDASGMETARLQAEARLTQDQIGSLRADTKSLSRAGMRFEIQGIQFTPSMADQEAVRSQLRSEIYKQAQAELERVNTLFKGQPFVIGHVDFISAPLSIRQDRKVAYMAVAESTPASAVAVSQKLSLSAVVTLQQPDKKTL